MPRHDNKGSTLYSVTVPRCDVTPQDLIDLWRAPEFHLAVPFDKIYVVQEHHKDNGLHLHAILHFEERFRFDKETGMRELDFQDGDKIYHPSIEATRSKKNWIKYMNKERSNVAHWNFPEALTMSPSHIATVDERKERNELILKRPLEELVEEGIVSVMNYPLLKKAKLMYQQSKIAKEDSNYLKGIWIYGDSGSGKSRLVRNWCANWPYSLYLKTNNKYWNDFLGEDVVLLEELSPNDLHWDVGYYLKMWADHYVFKAECKLQADISISFKYIVVTSNYDIETIFQDPLIAAPILRRFQQFKL